MNVFIGHAESAVSKPHCMNNHRHLGLKIQTRQAICLLFSEVSFNYINNK